MPLIALVIGYEVRLQRGNLSTPAEPSCCGCWCGCPSAFCSTAVVGPLFPATLLLQAAVMTMFVLPPPFVIPLFMREREGADRTFVVNTLSLATLVTLLEFMVANGIVLGLKPAGNRMPRRDYSYRSASIGFSQPARRAG